jgi:hypothetical protein
MTKIRVEVPVVVPEHTETEHDDVIRCDKCGREISQDIGDTVDEDLYPQELVIELNPNLCVIDALIRLDYCKTCLHPIWQQICAALGIDEHEQHRIGQDDD